jgi:hypothetical protein
MTELNPNHGVTIEMREQYHKLLAFVIWKSGSDRLVITAADLERFQNDRPDGTNLVVEPKNDIMTLRIVTDEEGRRLARMAGGLPS